MKQIILTLGLVVIYSAILAQIICNPAGNTVLYSNYDGGYLRINVDVNIPNLKIGVTTYESIQIEITGAYASNVTQVVYAGYASTNDHCGTGHTAVTIIGVPAPYANIQVIPPATWSDPNGYPYIICAFNCSGSTGGCNTPEQISHYFLTQFGGTLYSHFTQYGCYNSSTVYNVSDGGNCCAIPNTGTAPTAAFSANNTNICEGDCISFSDQSSNLPTSWSWTFQGASVSSSGMQNPVNICYPTAGTYAVTLSASNTNGSNTLLQPNYITVHANPTVPTITQNFNALVSSSSTGNQWYLNNNILVGATGQTYMFTQNGNYKVKVTNAAGCSSMSAAYSVTTTGMGAIATSKTQVFPNPVSDRLFIQTTTSGKKIFKLMTLTGIVLMEGESWNTDFEISTASLSSGVYLLELGGEHFKIQK